MNEDHQSCSRTGCCPFEHLLISIRVAEGGDGTLADHFADVHRLSGTVIDGGDLRQAVERGSSILRIELRLEGGSNDLLLGDPVGLVGPGTHELLLTTRDD